MGAVGSTAMSGMRPQGGQRVGDQIVPNGYEVGANGRVEAMASMPSKGGFGGLGGKGGIGGSKAPVGSQPSQSQYAPLSPQGSFNVNQAAAGSLQQAMQGTQQAMGFQPQQIGAATYNPQAIGSQGYNAAQAGSQGYNVAQAGSRGFDAARTGSQGYDAAQAGSQGFNASTIAGASPIQAQNVRAGQVAGSNLGAYTNPYETQVVDAALGDLERSRQMQQNQLGAQASASNAFGGSRQGIAESETNRAFAEQAAQTASGLRQAGFQNAQQLAGQDIGYRMQAGMANQGANLTAQGQTAGNMLAAQQANQNAYNQAGQFGASAANTAALQNQAALNQAGQFGASASNAAAMQNAANLQASRQFGAGAANTASLQNQAAYNQAGQFGAGAANTAALQNQAALNQAGQFGAGAANAAAMQNQAAFNQAGQFNAGAMNSAMMQNQQAAMQANQQRLAASGQMGALGQQAFNTGQTIQQNQMQQGLMQQGLQQALIDAARGQYAGYTGSPGASLNAPLAALGVAGPNSGSTTTQTQNRGLFDYLGLGLGAYAASDQRLKTNIKPRGEVGGVKLYDWDWNDEGKRIADPAQPTFGVMADELQETHPHLVKRGEDGYLRVNYHGLVAELEMA